MKKYKTIVVDPPWRTHAGMTSKTVNGKWFPVSKISSKLEYPTMSVTDISKLPITKVADDGCHLFLWTINSRIEDAYKIARIWGFNPSTLLVWCKNPRPLHGDNFSINTEFCIYARKIGAKLKERPIRNWWLWKRGKHSQKPEEFQDIVERVSPGPYLELFARRKREEWDVWGNEVDSDIDLLSYKN